jgi:hypothetical protein
MKRAMSRLGAGAAIAILGVGTASSHAETNLVRFPEGFDRGVRYATVQRGNITEEIYANPETIEAVKAGRPIPSGAVLTLVDSRDGKLFRYVVMEKRTGWGGGRSESNRTGEWEFQWFTPSKAVKADEDLARCQACHNSQAGNDFVWTFNRLKNPN